MLFNDTDEKIVYILLQLHDLSVFLRKLFLLPFQQVHKLLMGELGVGSCPFSIWGLHRGLRSLSNFSRCEIVFEIWLVVNGAQGFNCMGPEKRRRDFKTSRQTYDCRGGIHNTPSEDYCIILTHPLLKERATHTTLRGFLGTNETLEGIVVIYMKKLNPFRHLFPKV